MLAVMQSSGVSVAHLKELLCCISWTGGPQWWCGHPQPPLSAL